MANAIEREDKSAGESIVEFEAENGQWVTCFCEGDDFEPGEIAEVEINCVEPIEMESHEATGHDYFEQLFSANRQHRQSLERQLE